jgi:hypothetical protein
MTQPVAWVETSAYLVEIKYTEEEEEQQTPS